MRKKFEIRNSKFEARLPLVRPDSDSSLHRDSGRFEFFRRFRLPLRESSNLEQTAARTRAERLFAVNFRHPWTR